MSQPLARIDDQYEVVAKIKEGGMGEIYKVRHRLLDELRIVKILHSELVGNSELNERFAREARATIKLRHPNIVQIFDFTLDPSGAGLIVMEYIRGTDLKQLIARPELPSIALTVEIARQSLRALGFLHRHGFVHRDISPDNLMLSVDVEGRPLVKIIDLGIAKRPGGTDPQLTASGIFLGKFRYSSPEHFGARGSGAIEARSDLYSFGLVLYELLTGKFPIRGKSTSQLIAGHLFQPPRGFAELDPDGRIPERLRQAVLKTLAKEPAERFADAEGLIACLDDLRVDYPLSAEVLEESLSFATGAARAESAETSGAEADAVAKTRRLSQERPGEPSAPREPGESVVEVERRLLHLIRKQDLVTARETLAAAVADSSSEAAFEPLFRLLSRTVNERIQDLVGQAGLSFEAERFDDAADCLSQVLALDPGDDWIRNRLERARAGQRRQEEEIRRRQQQEAKARARLRAAEQASADRDVLKARLLLAEALELEPDLEEAAALATQLDQQTRAAELSSLRTTPLSPGLMKAYADIEGLRAGGDFLAAWRRLKEAIEEFGEIDTFIKLRRQIAEEIMSSENYPS